jgi:hypothetical protein
VGLERGTFSLVSTIEEYGRRGSVVLTTQHPLYTKVGINFADNGGRWVGIGRSRTQATEFFFYLRQEDVYREWICRSSFLVLDIV